MIGNDGARSDAFHDRSRTWIDLAAPDGYDIRSTDRTCTNSWMNLNYRSAAPATATIPDLVRFGTSTWTYEGWQGQVYRRKYAPTAFPGY